VNTARPAARTEAEPTTGRRQLLAVRDEAGRLHYRCSRCSYDGTVIDGGGAHDGRRGPAVLDLLADDWKAHTCR